MFGVSRKKSKFKQQVRSATLDDDDDDDAQHRAQQIQQRQKNNKKKKVKGEKSKKAATTSILSFDPDEEINDEYESPINRTKKRKKDSAKQWKHHSSGGGLGYGGIHAPTSDGSASDGEVKMAEDDDDEEGNARIGSLYDKSALEKLRREQKRTTLVQDGSSESLQAPSSFNEGDIISLKEENEENTEDSFIPLSTGKLHHETSSHILDEVVLTGDEAMAFAQRQEDANNCDGVEFDHGLQSPPTPPPTSPSGGNANKKARTGKGLNIDMNFNMMDTDEQSNEEEEEGNRQWEDTMVRRAGVLPPKAASTDDDSSRSVRRQQHTNPTTLGQIRASLQPTISNLENVFSDLESGISRHETTIYATRDELSHNQAILKKHGKALEYYQGLREELATWMGALRELNGMVTKLEEAKRLVEAEMTIRKLERFVEWGNDCIDVLDKQGLLASTTVKANIDQAPTIGNDLEFGRVDEFGRDLSSLSSIARIKRWNQRRKRSLERLQGSGMFHESQSNLEQSIAYTNHDNIDRAEIEEWNKRCDAIAQALTIIPELVKEEYLSISNLSTIFFDWNKLYSEDYTSCYAEITLVQMIEVLARLELCERWNVLNLNGDLPRQYLELSDFKWFDAMSNSEGRDFSLIALEVVEKQVISRILHSFTLEDNMKGKTKQCGIYDPFSETETELLCAMVNSVLQFFRHCPSKDHRLECERMVEKLTNALMLLVRLVFEKLGMPVVDASKITMERNEFANRDTSQRFDNETVDAITYATVTQAIELCSLVKNIMGHWYPIFKRELRQQHDGVAALVRYVLEDIVSLRLLPVLHSLHSISSGGCKNDERYMVMPKTYVNDIMETIEKKALLDPSKWMLMLAPLRIAIKQWD